MLQRHLVSLEVPQGPGHLVSLEVLQQRPLVSLGVPKRHLFFLELLQRRLIPLKVRKRHLVSLEVLQPHLVSLEVPHLVSLEMPQRPGDFSRRSNWLIYIFSPSDILYPSWRITFVTTWYHMQTPVSLVYHYLPWKKPSRHTSNFHRALVSEDSLSSGSPGKWSKDGLAWHATELGLWRIQSLQQTYFALWIRIVAKAQGLRNFSRSWIGPSTTKPWEHMANVILFQASSPQGDLLRSMVLEIRVAAKGHIQGRGA